MLLVACSFTKYFRFVCLFPFSLSLKQMLIRMYGTQEPSHRQFVVSILFYATMMRQSQIQTFIQENVGAISIGSLLRKRILEAGQSSLNYRITKHRLNFTCCRTDRAKLAFVSQVSHELRTPLHAIGSQLELIRTITTAPFLKTIGESFRIWTN